MHKDFTFSFACRSGVRNRQVLCYVASDASVYPSVSLFCEALQSFHCYFYDININNKYTGKKARNLRPLDLWSVTAGKKASYKTRNWGIYARPCHRSDFLPRRLQFSSGAAQVRFVMRVVALGRVIFEPVNYHCDNDPHSVVCLPGDGRCIR